MTVEKGSLELPLCERCLVVGGNEVGYSFLYFFKAWLILCYDGFVAVKQIEQWHGGKVVGGFFIYALCVVPTIGNKWRKRLRLPLGFVIKWINANY